MNATTKTLAAVILGLGLVATIAYGGLVANSALSSADASKKITVNAAEFQKEMRFLWADHVIWTRLYIVSFAADLDDQSVAAERLLENQQDIGDAIKPFYGDDAGEELSDLLTEHILIAVDLLDAAKAQDADAVADAEERWYANAHDIAVFLASINPNFSEEEMEQMLREHLDLTEQEAVARLSGDFETDRDSFDQIHAQAMEMADALSGGIIAQFPKQFK
ncbi:MAG TPA: hypothetical protein VJM08_09245 [Anaerolineales bacterium]|nr:hypothetical protein [Anaerolineales bacterium]